MTLFRQILALSIPAIVANIATPLMSMSDMAISGRMGSADIIASVALGGVIFNLLYWLLGFLRMGTSGLTAQAFGAADRRRLSVTLLRSVTVAVTLGLLILALQQPIINAMLRLMDARDGVMVMTGQYCRICIWGAPAVLTVNACAGWFVGNQNSRLPMAISLAQVALNIVLSWTLVFAAGMQIEGLAVGTVTAQWVGALLFLAFSLKRVVLKDVTLPDVFDFEAILKFFRINTDIFLRTLCMVGVTFWFTRTGTIQGNVVLAANALIMQLFTLFSYFMDGFAYAAEGICGKMAGASDYQGLRRAERLLYNSGAVLALVCSLIYFIDGDGVISVLSHDHEVNRAAHEYIFWAATIPLAGFAAFIGDGIAVGLIHTRMMLMSLVVSTAVFFATYLLAFNQLGNHGLWLAFIMYLLSRSVYLGVSLKRNAPAKS